MDISSQRQKDFRAFVFAVHLDYGMLLLHCTRKPKKGHHFQLPGGHLDDSDFESAATHTPPCSTSTPPSSSAETIDPRKQYDIILLLASKIGAARELYEETGINLLSQLDRFEPNPVRQQTEEMSEVEFCSVKDRCYFNLVLTDNDFPKESDHPGVLLDSPLDDNGNHLKLKLSDEHSGYRFEPNPNESIQYLKKHSNGVGSKALHMSMKYHDTRHSADK
mmetsp:Transcript_14273/g.16872  ORF Transcript_14273/g.16872 Transcript_14273/m.16872 type:complete len:220 (-) Transcript_14273:526-1185(-)|eukprot:CAMPEP_0198269768 /NCGR_PEP_ID=MMETSP1447-20131203/42489_1 /TAXON_ID=420782 /ORGANISM="Chaetoceros dichaeta, Strain CCMP1751" /LENGTH=219 /DNA_ID=CAMNT_0043961487 /DNA_START=23 /DNA_END=682 /DNA_ORIENTATION=+